MMGTGTALWIALGFGSTCVAVDVLCGVLTGFGSGALLLAWGISFCALRCTLDLFKLGCRARDRHGAVCVSSASCA